MLWHRSGQLGDPLATKAARFPAPDPQWLEDRFWVWVHYTATKAARGELFETLAALSALRSMMLGPLILLGAGARPSGVRKIELLTATTPARRDGSSASSAGVSPRPHVAQVSDSVSPDDARAFRAAGQR